MIALMVMIFGDLLRVDEVRGAGVRVVWAGVSCRFISAIGE